MLVVVLDTNIWVSALINPQGFPAYIVDSWLSGNFEVAVSLPLLEEIVDVLTRQRIQVKYGIVTEQIDSFLTLLQARAIHVIPTGQLQLCRDPDDDLILETAILGDAQVVVTRDGDLKGDNDLIVQMKAQGIQVLSVSQFLDSLEKE